KAGPLEIHDRVDWERALLGRRTGEPVPIQVERGGQVLDLDLVLAPARGTPAPSLARNVMPIGIDRTLGTSDRTWTLLGLNLTRIENESPLIQASRYRGGMRITGIRPGSPADNNGLREGD